MLSLDLRPRRTRIQIAADKAKAEQEKMLAVECVEYKKRVEELEKERNKKENEVDELKQELKRINPVRKEKMVIGEDVAEKRLEKEADKSLYAEEDSKSA